MYNKKITINGLVIWLKYKHVNICAIFMRQICLRIIFNMYINDALILQGIKALDTLTYMHMIPILRFFTPFYTENYLLNFICHHKYTHIRTHSTIAVITNIFIKQSINIGEG